MTFEYPVNVSMENEFCGQCAVGAFSYLNPFGKYSDVRIGRYCSLAEWLIIGPGQHNTHAFSTHPFIGDPEDNTARLSVFESYRAILCRTPVTTKLAPRWLDHPTVEIGHDVWIGTRAMIMQGVKIGHGAVIAAGAVVTKDVAPYTIVGGVPAKPIRRRFSDELISALLELQWWNYDMSTVSNRVNYGEPAEVIDFMHRARASGELRPFVTATTRIERTAQGYNVTPVTSPTAPTPTPTPAGEGTSAPS